VLDECIEYPSSHEHARASTDRTVRWARKAFEHFRKFDDGNRAVFPIVQGSMYADLRTACAEQLLELDARGYAIGGLSVGEPRAMTYDLLAAVTERLPASLPRYLMGVGVPPSSIEAVRRGVDMFDCVLPTRVGRTGVALAAEGRLQLLNAALAGDLGPLEEDCPCPACRGYTRAYLRHLFKAGEMLGPRLVSLHNITFMARLIASAREAILEDRFDAWSGAALARYKTAW